MQIHIQGTVSSFLMLGVELMEPRLRSNTLEPVLIMPDGRLGLLDYGMIGRFDEFERQNAVDIVLALADGKVEETASIYTSSGYKAKIKAFSGVLDDPAILHRFATFHWDRIDLSPVTWSRTGKTQDIFTILNGVVEPSVPKWIEDGRRLGALMMGPHIQSGYVPRLIISLNPVSLLTHSSSLIHFILIIHVKSNFLSGSELEGNCEKGQSRDVVVVEATIESQYKCHDNGDFLKDVFNLLLCFFQNRQPMYTSTK